MGGGEEDEGGRGFWLSPRMAYRLFSAACACKEAGEGVEGGVP
jgi:hypothetical protein